MRMTAALRPVLDLPARLGLARAPDAYYALPVPRADERRPLAVAWLALGLAALVASGIFSLLLVAARTPFLAPLFPVADFFHVALVVHVDLSVLVWFAACAGLVWTVNGARAPRRPRLVRARARRGRHRADVRRAVRRARRARSWPTTCRCSTTRCSSPG